MKNMLLNIGKSLFIVGVLNLSTLYANVNTVVSVVPQKTFVKAIGGDKVNVSIMVKPGSEPETYEPKPSQMKDIAKADLYFAIGFGFEEVWLKKFANQNKNMKIIDLSNHIKKIPMVSVHRLDVDSKHHEHNSLDPHIWLSPKNVKVIAKDIYENLVKIDSKNRAYYKNNYDKFLIHIKNTDKKIKKVLVDVETGSNLMVFHPAWGYFSRDYGLTQLAIEVDGKNPKPKQVMLLIKRAKKENVKAIFTAPEFNQKIAKQVAHEVGVPVISVSPLNPNWSENLINLAKDIARK